MRDLAEQPVPGNSDMIDIEQLLKQLLPVDTVVEETTADVGKSGSGRQSVGKRRLIRGGGLVTRISDNEEPQFDNSQKYREQPVRKKDTMKYEEPMLTTGYDPHMSIDDYIAHVPRYIDSDESDSDEM